MLLLLVVMMMVVVVVMTDICERTEDGDRPISL